MPLARQALPASRGRRRIAAAGVALALLASAALLAPRAARAAGMLAPGDTFPEWSLRDQTRQMVRSQDMAGKTYLLWFYPKAMTPGCTAEGQALRDSFSAFTEKGVEVLGVSFDSPEENRRFAQTEGFPFRLLSDDGGLAIAVGAADARDQATPRRISYLVGPDGKVLRAYASVNPATHAEEVLRDVSALTSEAPPAS